MKRLNIDAQYNRVIVFGGKEHEVKLVPTRDMIEGGFLCEQREKISKADGKELYDLIKETIVNYVPTVAGIIEDASQEALFTMLNYVSGVLDGNEDTEKN